MRGCHTPRASGDPGAVPEAILAAFASIWIGCVHVRERCDGGCADCWGNVREAASHSDPCEIATAVLAIPERPADESQGYAWAVDNAALIADVGAATERFRLTRQDEFESALIAIHKAMEAEAMQGLGVTWQPDSVTQ